MWKSWNTKIQNEQLHNCNHDILKWCWLATRNGAYSIEGIRSYKRTSLDRQENISDIRHSKKPGMDLVPVTRSQFTKSCLSSLPPPLPMATTLPCSQNNISAPHTSSSSDNHAGIFYKLCSNIIISKHNYINWSLVPLGYNVVNIIKENACIWHLSYQKKRWKKSAIPKSTTSDTKCCFKLVEWLERVQV